MIVWLFNKTTSITNVCKDPFRQGSCYSWRLVITYFPSSLITGKSHFSHRKIKAAGSPTGLEVFLMLIYILLIIQQTAETLKCLFLLLIMTARYKEYMQYVKTLNIVITVLLAWKKY